MKVLAAILLGVMLFSCQASPEHSKESNEEQEVNLPPIKEPFYEVVVSENGSSNFGYQILKDGKLVINQQTIPAIPGTSGFNSKEKAQKAGEFTLSKIQSGSFPPTVSPEELDSLGVL